MFSRRGLDEEVVGVETEVAPVRQHPIVAGYFQLIPKVGANWPAAERAKWLTGLTDSFQVLFRDEKPATS